MLRIIVINTGFSLLAENYLFRPAATGTVANQVVFDASGNVGIGTDSPAHKLHINQPGNIQQLRIQGNNTYDFYSYNDNNFYINNPNGTVLGLLANKDAYFGKNLSIGDSILSTYHANYPALDIGSSASVQGYTGNNGVWLQSNLFMNTNGQWTSKSDDYSAMLELYDGNFNFYNTASGTGSRTLLTPMTIRQNGTVGIGGVPTSVYGLEIQKSNAGAGLYLHNKDVPSMGGAGIYHAYQITQTNGQSARLAEITALGASGWGGELLFSTKPD